MIFLYTLIANTIIGLALIGLIFVLRLFKNKIVNYLSYFTAVTVGILLGIIFLSFIPELTEQLEGNVIGIVILSGLLFFYLLELLLHHHHCHDIENGEHKHNHEHSNETLMFFGTLLHNMMHGLVIFSAFTVGQSFGIATAIAVLLHSIPQNTANYIMNHNKELFVWIAALGGIFGTLLLFPFAFYLAENEGIVLGFVCGGLLYLTLSDILPEVKNKGGTKIKLIYLVFILLGLSFVFLLNFLH